jgi:tetratricopeptide (TPR) repeat protein
MVMAGTVPGEVVDAVGVGAPAPEAVSSALNQASPALEPAVAEHIRALEESAEELARGPASSERIAEAEGLLGQVYHAYSLAASAEARYGAAQRLAPADFRWPYLLAHLLQQENRADEALTLFERARAIRGDYAPLYVHLGNLHLAQNRLADATRAFEAALAVDDSIAAARYGLGQVAMSRREYARAVEFLSRVLAAVPDANRVHYVIALAYRGLDQLERAQAHLARQGPVGVRVADPVVDALQDLVRGERLWLVRGRMAFDAGRHADAADAFRKALAAEPASVAAHVNLGTALGLLKDVDGALHAFEKALTLDPDNRPALYNLAVLHAGRQRHDAAARHLTRLVQLAPDDHAAHLLLGRELHASGRLEDARATFEQLRRAAPDDEDAVLGHVDALTALGRHRDAFAEIDRSHARFPSRGRTAARLAYLLAASPDPSLRDPARALPLARQVYDASGAVGHGAVVAMALAAMGRCEEAVSWQRELIAKAERQDPTLVDPLRSDFERYRSSCP